MSQLGAEREVTDARLGDAGEAGRGEIPFRAIAEYTYDWESWIDATGVPRWINATVTRFTGRGPEECLALTDYPLCLVHADDRAALAALLGRARHGESHNHHEFRILHVDGSIRWGAISFQALRGSSGEFLGYRTSVRDIEEHRRMQDEMRELLERARAADRAKTAFLASVSHELRTPLQSIIGYAELLSDEANPERRRAHARTVLEQGRHLERLVGDLLDYSALTSGKLTLRREPMSITQLMDRVVRAFWPMAQQKGLSLGFDRIDALLVQGDAKRLAQVLTNLVSNAIKYTPIGTIRLRARIDEPSGLVVLGVDDSGPGVADPTTIFEPFQRGLGQFEEGLGLGLAIGRALCRQMGGDLELVPAKLGGASFEASFSLEWAERQGGAEAPRMPSVFPSISSDPLTVLVVDDMEAARTYLADAIGGFGHRVLVACSAGDALALAQGSDFDLVLLDLQMPEVDGWQAATQLRQALGPGPWMTALSAGSVDSAPAQLWGTGFDGALRKPIDRHGLATLLERTATRRMRRRAAGMLDDFRRADLAAQVGRDGRPLLERTLARVRTELPQLISHLTNAAGAFAASRSLEHLEGLRRAAHEARGLAALIGAVIVKERAAALEDAGEQVALDDAIELVVALDALERRLAATA